MGRGVNGHRAIISASVVAAASRDIAAPPRSASSPVTSAAAMGMRRRIPDVGARACGGPETALLAVAIVDFACAAASLAAEVRSPLVCRERRGGRLSLLAGVSFGGAAFFAGAAFLAGVALPAALAGAFLAGVFLARGLLRRARLSSRRAPSSPAAPMARSQGLRHRDFRRADPAGLPCRCSFECLHPAVSPSCQVGIASIPRVSR